MQDDVLQHIANPLLLASCVTICIYVAVEKLAKIQLDKDARYEAEFRLSTEKFQPDRALRSIHSHCGTNLLSSVQIYWPKTLQCSQLVHLYGWYFTSGSDVFYVVVAGAHAERDSKKLPADVQYLGTSSETIIPPRYEKEIDMHVRSGPKLAWYVKLSYRLNHPRLSTDCLVTILIYTPPDPLALESYMIEASTEVTSFLHEKLEELIALDPDRRYSIQTRNSSAGLAKALAYINTTKYAMLAPLPTFSFDLDFDCVFCSMSPYFNALLTLSATYRYARWIVRGVVALLRYLQHRAQLASSMSRKDYTSFFENIRKARASLSRAWNTLLLLLISLFLGWILSIKVEQHAESCAKQLDQAISGLRASAVHQVLHWLASWPFGIKLNTEMSHFLRDSLSSVAEVYDYFLLSRINSHGMVLTACRLCRWVGIAGAMCVLADSLRVVSMHLAIMYAILRRVYSFSVSSTRSLFDVFRGRKRNPLHKRRLDAAHYEVDQLFLGTILFTLLVFLFPTLLLFYVTCALGYGAVLMVYTSLMVASGIFTAFPIYSIILRYWNPGKISQGIVFHVSHSSVYELQSCATSLSDLLDDCSAVLKSLRYIPLLALSALRGAPMAVSIYPD